MLKNDPPTAAELMDEFRLLFEDIGRTYDKIGAAKTRVEYLDATKERDRAVQQLGDLFIIYRYRVEFNDQLEPPAGVDALSFGRPTTPQPPARPTWGGRPVRDDAAWSQRDEE